MADAEDADRKAEGDNWEAGGPENPLPGGELARPNEFERDATLESHHGKCNTVTTSELLFWKAAPRLLRAIGGGFNGLATEIEKLVEREKECVQPVKKSA